MKFFLENVIHEKEFILIMINFLLCVLYLDHRRFKRKNEIKNSLLILVFSNVLLLFYIYPLLKLNDSMIWINLIFFIISDIIIILSYTSKNKLFKLTNGLFFFCMILLEYVFFSYMYNISTFYEILPKTYEKTFLTYIIFIELLLWVLFIISYKVIDFTLKRLGLIPDFNHMETVIVGSNETYNEKDIKELVKLVTY